VHVPSRLVSPEQKLREGDYVVCLASGSKHLVGKAAPFPGELECSFGAFCGAIRPWMALPFIAVFLASPLYRNAVSFASAGIGINNLKSTSLLELDIPVPPLAEQNRIVTQVEELMKLCDALELNGRLADEQHARITSTLFDALTASESAHALAENWERVAENFDLLLDRAEAVISLERVVLELAVRGLLVPQVKSDEPAGAILHRVQQRTRTKSIKDKPQPGSVDDIAPYVLPKGWEWIRLGDLVEDMGSGWSPACDEGERSDVERWAVLRTTAVQVMEYRAREHKAIPLKFPPRPEIEVKNGDILLTRAGPMNRVGISCWVHDTPPRLILSDKIIRFHSIGDEMLPEYVVMTLNAGWTKNLIDSAKSGMAASQVNISQSDVRSLFIPVCSRSEQVRVTQRVKQLRELCSRLSERIRMRQGTQNSLAEALVDAPHTV
jgi:type I restriction enzyme S subunit